MTKFLIDITTLAGIQILALAAIVALQQQSLVLALSVATGIAFSAARLLHCSRAWTLVNTLLLPGAFATLLLTDPLSRTTSLILTVVLAGWLATYLPTCWTRVPFYRTHAKVVPFLVQLIKEELSRTTALKTPHILDIGSGFGGIMISLHHHLPNAAVSGIEISPLPAIVTKLRTLVKPNLTAHWGSLWSHSLRSYNVVYAFLSPEPMAQLWTKAKSEMAADSLLISYQFAIPQVRAERVITIPGNTSELEVLYVYRIEGSQRAQSGDNSKAPYRTARNSSYH